MTNWKKAGLTALAGSLVASSAFAGAVTVTGSANLTYTANSGQEDAGVSAATGTNVGMDGARWGMGKSLTFSGSGEMDNGWTVSVSQGLANGVTSGQGFTLDMGDMGTLDYQAHTSARGIGKIKDMMPTADEDVGNGIDVDGTGTVGGLSGTVNGGVTGFHYGKVVSDMVEIGIGYSPKGSSTASAGAVTGSGGASTTSAFIKLDPMDGLEVGFGVGETKASADGDNSQTDDHSTVYVSYVYGPLTVAYQTSEIDTYTAAQSDDESTNWGVLYAVNDEMSISYHDHVNDDTTATDEEVTGWSASYTVGSMTFKAHRNHGDNLGNAANKESEHTEIGVTFAF